MRLNDFTPEIFDIATANNADIGVGMDMFIANVQHAGEAGYKPYPGAEKIDWRLLKPYEKALIKSIPDYNIDTRECYEEITTLYREKRYEEIREIMSEIPHHEPEVPDEEDAEKQ